MPLNGDTINADKLSGIDEESDIYEGFSPHVDRSQIVLPDPSPTSGEYSKALKVISLINTSNHFIFTFLHKFIQNKQNSFIHSCDFIYREKTTIENI